MASGTVRWPTDLLYRVVVNCLLGFFTYPIRISSRGGGGGLNPTQIARGGGGGGGEGYSSLPLIALYIIMKQV